MPVRCRYLKMVQIVQLPICMMICPTNEGIKKAATILMIAAAFYQRVTIPENYWGTKVMVLSSALPEVPCGRITM